MELSLYLEHAIQVRVDVITPNQQQAKNVSIAIVASLFAFLSVPIWELVNYVYERFYVGIRATARSEQLAPTNIQLKPIEYETTVAL